jgi:Cd2+/Zn2+-exporting ATPase
MKALAVDKTGTLTIGQPEVVEIAPGEGYTEERLLGAAAAVERHSQHPLAAAIVRRAEANGLVLPHASDVQSVTGKGVRARVDADLVEIGNLKMWEQSAIPKGILATVGRLQGAGQSTMIVRQGDAWLGVIGVADKPREGVKNVIASLSELGVRPIVMLTGDNRTVGESIARAVGVDEVRADLMPEEKLVIMRELLATHTNVGMVGDGVNDAPALAHATVGIAMGGAGTAVALETADVALMSDDLSLLPFVVSLSRKAKRVIRQNLYISMAVIALLIITTTTGIFRIGLAVVIHEGSTLVVIANALRLLRHNDRGLMSEAT